LIGSQLQGGLGNQLFQIAAAYGHAKTNGFEYGIVNNVINPHAKEQKPYVFPGINYVDDYNGIREYKERHYHWHEIPPVDDLKLDGFWQSPKYFDEYRDEVIEAFGMEIPKIIQGWCGLHVRRGDYLKFPDHHPVQKQDYYFSPIGLVKQKLGIKNFVVISDDMPWCKETFDMLPHFEFEYSEGKDEIEDMKLFGSCAHQICSNSSYSWWGHYFNPNPNKLAVAPHKWFGELLGHNTKDLYTNSMIRI